MKNTMKITTVLILALMMTTSAFARRDRIEQRILNQVESIKADLPFSTVSNRELRQALNLLKQAKRVIAGGSHRQPPVPPMNLQCVDRDGDNLPPYVLSYVENFDIIKLTNVTFKSMSNCQRSINDTFFVQGIRTMCVARDGDNLMPYSLVTFKGVQLTKITSKFFSSYSKCRNIKHRGVSRQDGLIFCIDRDNDNRAPYVIRKFNARNKSIRDVGSTSFSSMEKCEQVLFR